MTGWAFLVARGRETGYRLLLAPDLPAGDRGAQALAAVVCGEVPAGGPPRVTRDGALCIVHRTYRPTRADVGGAGSAPLRDGAGRPLLFGYGFVCRDATVIEVAEEDLASALRSALATFGRFYRAEAGFAAEPAEPFPLRSTVGPADPSGAGGAAGGRRGDRADVAAAGGVPAAWSASAFEPPPGRRPTPARAVAAAAIAAALLGGAAGTWFATRPDRVAVPEVTGLAPADAERLLREAGLRWTVDPTAAAPPGCRPGVVAGQVPARGAEVIEESAVTLVICPGPVAGADRGRERSPDRQ